jgi:plasmid stabilization system protein ParE
MALNRDIIWSQEALNNLDNIIDYLRTTCTEKDVIKFKALLSRRIKVIASFPGIFPKAALNATLQKSVISKQTSIVYQVRDNAIYIVYLFDNRMNPSKLK